MTIDPTLHYCNCGQIFKPKTYHKLIMLLKGSFLWTCPKCQTKIRFEFIGHVVKIDSERVLNERIWENG